MNYAREMSGTVAEVFYGKEDHGILTCVVYVNGEHGSQGFGCLALDETTGPSFKRELCRAFGVADVERIKGLDCVACYVFGKHNDPIDALRGPAGTFDLHAWRKQLYPGAPSAVEAERARLRAAVDDAQRRFERALHELEMFQATHKV